MKRTKPTKQEKDLLKDKPDHYFGGYMPNPPDDCSAQRVTKNGEEFICVSLCLGCKYFKTCKRLKEFEKEWKEYWKTYKEIRGKYHGQDEDNS